jgi:ABC-type arginine/histidine transport system permease subunit
MYAVLKHTEPRPTGDLGVVYAFGICARFPGLELTIVLKFCTALIGFVVAVPLLACRVRRRWRRRR